MQKYDQNDKDGAILTKESKTQQDENNNARKQINQRNQTPN